ncbi:hypothetical protein [Pseudoduganella sp. RAF53_2]|uniref:hypothetical protein n=1 Tax=unclassified Pseudoduganella TaxID=2637179 RepID=UPI003F96012B
MTTIQTAFENYCHDKPVDLRKKADGRYLMGSTRTMWREFKVIYEIGQAAGRCEAPGRKPMGEALQQLASQARAMGMCDE